ncbi:hypothetical protein D3C71_1211630 [compost metagenome]
MQDVCQRPGGAGHHLGGLEHYAVAVGQCGRDLPGRDGDGEVPRRDDADGAQGFARDLDAHARAHGRDHLAAGAQRLAGKELEDGRGAAHFSDGFGQGLAFFAGQQVAQLGLARNDFVAHGVQDVKALLGRGHAPCGERRVGCRHGLQRLLAARHGVVADHIACVGGVGVLVGANAVSPGAANQVCMHGGGVVVKKRVLRKKGAVAC